MYLVEILTRCSKIEERAARVYRGLAERFCSSAEAARLWRELALEEETHADILRRETRAFEEQDDTGAFLPEYASRIEHVDRMLVDLERKVPDLQSLDAAVTLALAVEQAELEDLYDDLVTQGHPAFKLICERLESALSRAPASRIPGLPVRSQRGSGGEPSR
jgi:rubrerythrin